MPQGKSGENLKTWWVIRENVSNPDIKWILAN